MNQTFKWFKVRLTHDLKTITKNGVFNQVSSDYTYISFLYTMKGVFTYDEMKHVKEWRNDSSFNRVIPFNNIDTMQQW